MRLKASEAGLREWDESLRPLAGEKKCWGFSLDIVGKTV